MSKSGKTQAERYFAGSPKKKDDKVIKQKEKTERERDGRMTRLRDLRLARETEKAAGQEAAKKAAAPELSETTDGAEELSAHPPRVHPQRS